MDSRDLLRNCSDLLERLMRGTSETFLVLNKLLESVIDLKNKFNIVFDLESFSRISQKDTLFSNFDNLLKDCSQTGTNLKKASKRVYNLYIVCLIQNLKKEDHFEYCLDRFVDLLDLEYDTHLELKPVKSLEFLDLFLICLFLGSYYHLGIVQHFLLNSNYTVYLPSSLNNIINNFERIVRINELLNDGSFADLELFYQRFLIFVSKLNPPGVYSGSTERQNKILKIPKKELALKNTVNYPENELNSVDKHMEHYSTDSDNLSEDTTTDTEELGNLTNTETQNIEGLYSKEYSKLWETILNELMYKMIPKNLVIILESLPGLAFPYLNNPLRIVNFLYDNLNNSDKDVVINCLDCLFELILYYKLTDQIISTVISKQINLGSGLEGQHDVNPESQNFDWFFNKLYNLIDFEFFSSNSNDVLILLIEKSLNSSMLPNRLVSSFIIRLVKVATLVDTKICNSLLIISFDLLQKHHNNLLYLIHSPGEHTFVDNSGKFDISNDGQNVLTYGSSKELNHDFSFKISKNLTKDHYNKNKIPKHKDDNMFLHELFLLLTHFNHDTTKLVGVFFTDLRQKNKVNLNLNEFLYSQNLSKHIEKSKNSQLNPFKDTVQNSTSVTKMFFQKQ